MGGPGEEKNEPGGIPALELERDDQAGWWPPWLGGRKKGLQRKAGSVVENYFLLNPYGAPSRRGGGGGAFPSLFPLQGQCATCRQMPAWTLSPLWWGRAYLWEEWPWHLPQAVPCYLLEDCPAWRRWEILLLCPGEGRQGEGRTWAPLHSLGTPIYWLIYCARRR